jgi:hypothetical protein
MAWVKVPVPTQQQTPPPEATAETPVDSWVKVPKAEPLATPVPTESGWTPPQTPTKDFIVIDESQRIRYFNKETGREVPKPLGKYATEEEAASAPSVLKDPEESPVPAPTPVAPTKPQASEKSWLDRQVGSLAADTLEYTKGLMGPVKGVVYDLPMFLVESAKQDKNPLVEAAKNTWETARSNPAALLFSSAHGVKEEGWGHLLTPKGAGELTADVLTNLTLLPILARGAGAVKHTLPTATQKSIDRGVGKVIPKYNWPDTALAAEGANEGRKMLGAALIESDVAKIRETLATPQPARSLEQMTHLEQTMDTIHANNVRLLQLGARPQTVVSRVYAQTTGTPEVKMAYAMDTQMQMLNNHELLDQLAKDGLVMPHKRTTGTTVNPDWPRIPNTADVLGKYAGAHVHPDIADIIPTLSRSPEATGFFSNFIRAWKSSKTIGSPNTHLNNVLGNVMFSHLAGANVLNPANTPFYYRALQELRAFGKDPNIMPSVDLQEAMAYGAVRRGFAGIELQTLENRLGLPSATPQGTMASGLRKLSDSKLAQKARDIYDLEDMVYRYAAYLKHRSGGMAPASAGLEVNKWFPSYSATSPMGRWLRGEGTAIGKVAGSPFTSFTLESARIYARAAQERPWRLAAAGAVPQAITAANLAQLGLTLEDWHDIRRQLPPHMQRRVLIPFAGVDGGLEFADMSDKIPLAELGFFDGDSLGDTGPSRSLLFGGPVWNAFKLWHNEDFTTGQPIVDPTKGEGAWDWMLAIIKGLAPLPPAAANLGRRVPRAMEEVPPRRFAPEAESPGLAVWRSLFPSLESITEQEAMESGHVTKKAQEQEMKRGRRSIQRNRSLTEGERERRLENWQQERERRRNK